MLKQALTWASVVALCALLYAPISHGQAESDTTASTPASVENALDADAPQNPDGETTTEAGVNEPVALDPGEAELIGRVNAEIDRRAATDLGADQTGLADATQGAVESALRAIFALCIVLGLIFLTYYSAKRWGKRVPILAGSSLGSVLGRIHLERGTTLHFVRTAGRVLVVGVNGNSVSLVADFDDSSFAAMDANSAATPDTGAPFNSDTFLAQLQASSQAMQTPTSPGEEEVDEDEIAVLRGDIQRLQRYLREESREPQD